MGIEIHDSKLLQCSIGLLSQTLYNCLTCSVSIIIGQLWKLGSLQQWFLLINVYRFSFSFFNISHTIYLTSVTNNKSHDNSNWCPIFYIDVITSSDELQQYSVMVEPVENFVLE